MMLNWENISIGEALKIRFNNDGESVAIGYKEKKITYNELYKISSDIALGLDQLILSIQDDFHIWYYL